MYRGLARLVGMEVLDTGPTFADEIATLKRHWDSFDFFFLHYKDTDKAGEDGDFDAKVAALERFDARLPDVLALRPDVLAVSGDHSTPSILAAHGWQPVPALVMTPTAAPITSAASRARLRGGALGLLPAQEHAFLMANASLRRVRRVGRRPCSASGPDRPLPACGKLNRVDAPKCFTAAGETRGSGASGQSAASWAGSTAALVTVVAATPASSLALNPRAALAPARSLRPAGAQWSLPHALGMARAPAVA
jgi:hypothetical protein